MGQFDEAKIFCLVKSALPFFIKIYWPWTFDTIFNSLTSSFKVESTTTATLPSFSCLHSSCHHYILISYQYIKNSTQNDFFKMILHVLKSAIFNEVCTTTVHRNKEYMLSYKKHMLHMGVKLFTISSLLSNQITFYPFSGLEHTGTVVLWDEELEAAWGNYSGRHLKYLQ